MRKLFRDNNYLLTLYAIIFAIFLYLPIIFIPIFSFNSGVFVKFPLEGFTLDWYRDLFDRPALQRAFFNSVKVGIFVSLLSTLLAVPAAMAIARYRMPGKRPIVGFMMLPLVVPGIIFGVALLSLANQLGMTLSLSTVTAGHMVICLPYAIAVLLPRFEGFNRSIEEASADLGENPWWTFWRVTFPNVRPGILACLLMTFTISFDEFFMAFFLSGPEITLPMYIWGQLRFPSDFPSLLALATLILAFSFLLIFASLKLGQIGATPTGLQSKDLK
ncbi:spermidine/putrescine ABC transporter permease protein [Octadecabacter antarcticus 307]|uniref:Spermidine/putrescine ABC transporter permease protein n=1 Tax=Octadecabacter antarcticus 307 TaxID=391626 RepID=M9RH01_9RHOB|nr:ABC transporter permease [Octadecabacter antarcticus]AGI69686.1 spermidine/putrescine ABC transporter permease protein [Octadecabacter antarcticus 307]